MGEQQNKALSIAIILIMINVFLVMGGAIDAKDAPTLSKFVKGATLNKNLDSLDNTKFQNALYLTNDQNKYLQKPTGDSFVVTNLDNLQSAPNIWAANDIFGLIWDALYMGSSAVVVVMVGIGLPPIIYVPFAILVYLTLVIGLYDYILGFIIAIKGLIFR